MTTARQEIAPEGVEGIYHCISRCVRRAFLCGEDPYTGRSFEHRKQWVQDRLKQFAEAFAIILLGTLILILTRRFSFGILIYMPARESES
ncbi:MAG: hypothetical protein V1816_12150 [Pseudomonadota bacterium]